MYSFLVLGLIPGTDIQITFEMWLEAVVVLSSIIIIFSFIKRYAHERRLNYTLPADNTQAVIDTTQLYPSA